mmetsp:Transcript_4778/g.10028  ORF Transcript_4778/g.10028 Transcript_4778/m.10028 type:complete len:285 (-) Transcript_4778:367-1221(-)
MTDPFGNYLCQKFMELCSAEQREDIVQRAAPSLVQVSLDMHGTRAAQKLIEHLSSRSQYVAVISALSPGVVQLIKDLNGNHVIQRCLQKFDPSDNQFIYDAVRGHCVEIATHRHGCCVLQRCIDHASHEQRQRLVSEIVANVLQLVQDPFGNYVVQYVMDLQQPEFMEKVVVALLGHLYQLSMQKFSSNVVEKCLQAADRQRRAMMVEELAHTEMILDLLQDPFGNYVIQRALSVASQPQLNELIEAIKPHLNALRNTPYGRRIQSRILKKAPQQGRRRDLPMI